MNEKMLTGTLLIIDDMPEYVNILLKFLTRIGFEVLMAYEGQKGLKMAQLHLPDLILLDIRMSGMDGFEVCKHLKSQSITQNIPVIFMTALTDSASKLKGFKLGAADYVTKPLQYEEVLARVNAHLKLHQLQMQIAEQNLQLQISQERYALAAAAGKTGVWDWNIQSHEIYLDAALKELLGYGDIELNQWSDWIALIHPSDSERVIEATQEYLQQPESEYLLEYRMLHKEGHIIWVMTRGSLIDDSQGSAYRMVGTTTDITEPQKTEEALKLVHQIFTTVLDSLEAAVYVTDIDTYELLFVNKNTQKLFNHEQPLGKICWQLISNQEQTCPCGSFCPASKLITVDGQTTDGYTWEYQNPKTQSWFYIQGRAIDWIDGRLVRLEVATEITQLKQTEKELIQAKDAAEVANRAKTAFMANITHELRTPLNSILGYTQLFQINQTLNQELQEGLTIIQRNGEHLLTLINDILDISKIEANQVKLVPVDFYLEPFLKNIYELFQMRAKQKGIAFHYQPVTPLPKMVHADKIRLRQILINLLSNAIKFTQTGKVTFKVGLVPTQNVNFQNQKIEFQVEDTGIGIAAEDADNIFLPFQQLGDWKHHSEGSGLGLAISKKLVEMMGGKLHVKSTLKQGSTFWTELHLPIVSNQPQITEQQVIIGIEGIVCKILIVDAQKEHRLVLVKLLENLLGFEVIEAETGLEGIKKAQQNKPDAILMELILSDMEGSEAIRQIRQIPQLSETVIIANSSNLDHINQQRCHNAGCNDFLAKPIDTDILLEKLRQHLNLEYIYGNSTTTQQHSDFFETHTSFQPKEDSSIEVFSKLTLEQATTLFNMTLKGDVYGIIEYTGQIEQTQAELKDFAIKIKQLAENLEIKAIRHIVKQYTEETSDNH